MAILCSFSTFKIIGVDQYVYFDLGGLDKQGNDGSSVTLRRLEYLQLVDFVLDEQETQASKLSSQLSLSLSLIQGAALNHVVSKNFLGRKYALEVRALHGLVTCSL